MRDLLGAEATALLAALDEPRAPGLRLNPLRGSVTDLAAYLPWRTEAVPWCPSGRVVSAASAEVADHALNDAGVYYQQDPAAMVVAEVLSPSRGELVVDVAAAPGGKATHASGLAGDRALVVANDLGEGRARSLLGNFERLGVTNAVVTHGPVDRLTGPLGGRADAVLLDAPCSGEGMFRRSVAARAAWSEAAVERHSLLQRRLIAASADLVAPGGRLVYSTCTFDPRENEEVVAWLLARREDFALEPAVLPGTSDAGRFGLPGAARVWPHHGVGDGHFVALLRRDAGANRSTASRAIQTGRPGGSRHGRDERHRRHAATEAELMPWRDFAAAHLAGDWLAGHRVERYGKRLLALPEGFTPLHGVHVLRAGVHLGDLESVGDRTRFEPSHALAMTAAGAWTGPTIDLYGDRQSLAAFRAGGTLPAEGAGGTCLVTYRGFPLGLARAKAGEARSLLPKGLRRLA